MGSPFLYNKKFPEGRAKSTILFSPSFSTLSMEVFSVPNSHPSGNVSLALCFTVRLFGFWGPTPSSNLQLHPMAHSQYWPIDSTGLVGKCNIFFYLVMYGPVQSLDFCRLEVVMTACSHTDMSIVIFSHHYAFTSFYRAFDCFFGALLLVQTDLVSKTKHW